MVVHPNAPARLTEHEPDELSDTCNVELDAERIAGLTVEQVYVMDLLSQGHSRSEIAAERQVQTKEVNAIIADVAKTLEVKKPYRAIYLLLDSGRIQVSDEERQQAVQKAAKLSPRSKEALETIMSDLTPEEAAKKLRLTEGTLSGYIYGARTAFEVHTAEEAVRVGYAAGLRAAEAEDIRGHDKKDNPILPPNVRKFIGWMYPAVSPEKLDQVGDKELETIARILIEEAETKIEGLDWRSTKKIEAAIESLQIWFEGQSIPKMAAARGRTEGSVLIGLSKRATKMANLGGIDGLLTKAQELLAAKETHVSIAAGQLAVGAGDEADSEETVAGVIKTIQGQITAKKFASTNESYLRPIKITELFEPEVVTMLNLSQRRLHIGEIIMALFGREAPETEHDEVAAALAGIAEAGFIFDEENGYYSTWREAPEVETTNVRPINLEPQAEIGTTGPIAGEQSQFYGDDWPRHSTTGLYPVDTKPKTLREMVQSAGISDNMDLKPKQRGRNKSRKRYRGKRQ